MKIVIGVDTSGHYKSVLNLAARLQLPDPHWMFANSVDVRIPMSAYGSVAEAAYRAEFVQLANVASERALTEATEHARSQGFDAQNVLLAGSAAEALAQFADDAQADLICVHSERKGRLGSFFLGSVSRGLAIGSHQSILISKGQVETSGPLKIVFATDHSEYANRAQAKLIEMKPKGIESIKVISALHVGDHTPIDKPEPLYASHSIADAIWHDAKARTDRVVQQFKDAGFVCSGELLDEPVNRAIAHAMDSSKADLLIMGAQGHGFMHRVVLGSTSLHQVVAEPYSVLIIRG